MFYTSTPNEFPFPIWMLLWINIPPYLFSNIFMFIKTVTNA